ncbi:MAG: hypothetical protein A3G33_06260 [Omnitrophica bacterium RIFCSPLOWO2_12_FULL_44_17]|uniref:Small ribosomal subunit protein bS20 n=1 Tax=Candidatus Danuiimicrobium aquiferis TaxID=1801832 RepID=A0A1G1KVG3_9BACT|nr:MAG: hypothetical protein A3B72_04805 [Omnitrophica bacterium RIFCSPHIGHO2_02_FULL_45_28]OGW88707.1 MAG: hypothetical protein A3E74_09585 [Omnitrophica bacterium RIFCSPHIGHO2_12_FULL_44_12]OGW96887.1 MAG: hypothetical protein A3G33_06260 [Omnitrophica bacterium RIFCSPLOWO2_12_FULL_44_17]OGX02420.1 MAG: hypothetical protein A3J12_05005 [Omnitrophica bacterium RIFCSPLOWO2_02_FULL_44_11]
MPILKSAAKRMRSDAKKRTLNLAALSELKTLQKKLVASTTSNPEEAKKLAREYVSKLDKAVTRGIIPHGRADRKKARVGKFLQ